MQLYLVKRLIPAAGACMRLRLLLCCSQQISFGLHNPQEIIHCGVFNVYERALFKVRAA
jgi:hypothetical protein